VKILTKTIFIILIISSNSCLKPNVESQIDELSKKIDPDIYTSLEKFFSSDISGEILNERTEKLPFSSGVFITEYDDKQLKEFANNVIDGRKGDIVSICDKNGKKISVGIYWRLTGVEYTLSNDRKILLRDKDIIYCKVVRENLHVFKCKR
jgi:hypothetical protein